METEASSQRSVIEESQSRVTMLENILAKEAVSSGNLSVITAFTLCQSFVTFKLVDWTVIYDV